MDVEAFGELVRYVILTAAGLLTEPHVPGLVSAGLVSAAIVIAGWFAVRTLGRLRAIGWMRRRVERWADRRAFSAGLIELDREMIAARDEGRNRFRRALATAWGEYHETMIVPGAEDMHGVVRNSWRPSSFFDSEELGFGAGFYRVYPALFVSVGLLLTFLGLIAALTAIAGGDINDESLRELLNAASAKFIMSLTGLLCSIVLTIILRIGAERIERGLRELCHAIEKRLRFESLEGIAREQLEATRQQSDAMRSVAMEMVAEIGRPLREELPQAISASIREQIAPVLQSVGQTGAEGVGAMVDRMSKQLSGDVGDALGQASARLTEAGDRLGGLADRLEGGGGRMGSQMEEAATRAATAFEEMLRRMDEQAAKGRATMDAGAEALLSTMTATLEAIRENTGAGAQAMRHAAGEMRVAAEGFREAIDGAAATGRAAAEDGMARAAGEAATVIGSAADGIRIPLDALTARLGEAAELTRDGAIRLERMAEAARRGGEAIDAGSERFVMATGALESAAAPLRDGLTAFRSAARDVNEGTRNALEAARAANVEVSARSRETLEMAEKVLGRGHAGIAEALEATQVALHELRAQGARIDEIDEKLGAAFERYRDEVESMVSTMHEHVGRMGAEFAPALDTMREVVQQAERFMPSAPLRGSGNGAMLAR